VRAAGLAIVESGLTAYDSGLLLLLHPENRPKITHTIVVQIKNLNDFITVRINENETLIMINMSMHPDQ
jgi:hypothetical protein